MTTTRCERRRRCAMIDASTLPDCSTILLACRISPACAEGTLSASTSTDASVQQSRPRSPHVSTVRRCSSAPTGWQVSGRASGRPVASPADSSDRHHRDVLTVGVSDQGVLTEGVMTEGVMTEGVFTPGALPVSELCGTAQRQDATAPPTGYGQRSPRLAAAQSPTRYNTQRPQSASIATCCSKRGNNLASQLVAASAASAATTHCGRCPEHVASQQFLNNSHATRRQHDPEDL